MSHGVTPTDGAPQTTADATPQTQRQEQQQGEALLRQLFEQMLLAEIHQQMSESLSK